MVAYCLLEEPKTCRWFFAVATLFVEGHIPKKSSEGVFCLNSAKNIREDQKIP